MKKEIKLVAIDLDDTLLKDDITVTPMTVDTVQAIREQGIDVVIATGRMYQTALPIAKKLGLGDVPFVLYSGGLIQCVHSGNILYQNAIPLSITTKMIALARDHDWYLQCYMDDQLIVKEITEVTKAYVASTGATPIEVGEAFYTPTTEPIKMLIIDRQERLADIAAFLRDEFGDAIEIVRSKETFLEIMAKGASKGAAVLSLAQEKGWLASEVMAIGNSENDISMLAMAGVAVAVGNAEEPVKEIADVVIGRNDEDGVAHWLSSYFLS